MLAAIRSSPRVSPTVQLTELRIHCALPKLDSSARCYIASGTSLAVGATAEASGSGGAAGVQRSAGAAAQQLPPGLPASQAPAPWLQSDAVQHPTGQVQSAVSFALWSRYRSNQWANALLKQV